MSNNKNIIGRIVEVAKNGYLVDSPFEIQENDLDNNGTVALLFFPWFYYGQRYVIIYTSAIAGMTSASEQIIKYYNANVEKNVQQKSIDSIKSLSEYNNSTPEKKTYH